MAETRCLRAAARLVAVALVFASGVVVSEPHVEATPSSTPAIGGEAADSFEALLRQLGEAHAVAAAAPPGTGVDDAFPELLRRVREEHLKALSHVVELTTELTEVKTLHSAASPSSAEAGGSSVAVAATPGFQVQAEGRHFLAPLPRRLQIFDSAYHYRDDVTVIPPGENTPADQNGVQPWDDVADPDMPDNLVSQFGWNICRNGNRQSGGCCQQIAHRCCVAHSRTDINWRWEMCFNGDTRMLTVTTSGSHRFQILAAQVGSIPLSFHARWEGPNDACFPEEDFTIYQFTR